MTEQFADATDTGGPLEAEALSEEVLTAPKANESVRTWQRFGNIVEFQGKNDVPSVADKTVPSSRFTQAELERIAQGIEGRLLYRTVKRLFDIAFSLAVLVVLLPVHLAVALAVYLDDPHGSPLFFQERVGRRGRTFRMVKFRSMYVDAEDRLESLMSANEKDGPVFKIKEDPRITRVGRFIRKTSLAPVIIGTPGDGEPTKSLSHPVNSSLDLHKCERRPEPFLVAQTHYTSSRFLSFAVFGGLNAARGRSFCACGATSSKDFRAVL